MSTNVIGFRNATLTLHTNVNCGITRRTRYANAPVIVTSAYAAEHSCRRCGDNFKTPSEESIRTAWSQSEFIRNKRYDHSWTSYCHKEADRMVANWNDTQEVIG